MALRLCRTRTDIKQQKLKQMDSLLQKAYSPEEFRKNGHDLINLLADHLAAAQTDDSQKVIPFINAEESLNYWQEDFEKGTTDNPMALFSDILERSTKLQNPRYMGHQVSAPAPLAALATTFISLLNNGMAVYEMGLVSNPLERIVTNLLAKRIGFDENATGLLTSGGTLANLTALLTARAVQTGVWEEGSTEKLAVMVSEEAHYCIDRAARIMGMGSEGIIKIPVNEKFQMRTELLEEYLQAATEKGFKVICVVGSACSTSTGSYDDLVAIADFAEKHQIWFHADGAHGGAVAFSDQYRHLIKGMERADSVVVDFHKMLLIPALTTALIYKKDEQSYQTFQQKAQYLWSNQSSTEWFNSGKRTFECTKLMMSVKVYLMLKTYGEEVFTEYVDKTYNLGKRFGAIIEANPNFELALAPECNIVCFRYVQEGKNLNEINAKLRAKTLEDGKFYIVQTSLKGQTYLRVSLMNPQTEEKDLVDLLEWIGRFAEGKE